MRLAGTAMGQVRIGVESRMMDGKQWKDVDLPGEPFLALEPMTDFL